MINPTTEQYLSPKSIHMLTQQIFTEHLLGAGENAVNDTIKISALEFTFQLEETSVANKQYVLRSSSINNLCSGEKSVKGIRNVLLGCII